MSLDRLEIGRKEGQKRLKTLKKGLEIQKYRKKKKKEKRKKKYRKKKRIIIKKKKKRINNK